MASTSIRIQNARLISRRIERVHYNWYSIISCLCACLFVAYLLASLTDTVPVSSSNFFTFTGVIILPSLGFILALVSFKSHARQELQGGSMMPSYIALSITTLYFMTALAIPLILVGSYILYTYIF